MFLRCFDEFASGIMQGTPQVLSVGSKTYTLSTVFQIQANFISCSIMHMFAFHGLDYVYIYIYNRDTNRYIIYI